MWVLLYKTHKRHVEGTWGAGAEVPVSHVVWLPFDDPAFCDACFLQPQQALEIQRKNRKKEQLLIQEADCVMAIVSVVQIHSKETHHSSPSNTAYSREWRRRAISCWCGWSPTWEQDAKLPPASGEQDGGVVLITLVNNTFSDWVMNLTNDEGWYTTAACI